jgi:pilus assembly protein CpaF
MSFTIIISEKGGAERRESFDKNEINVGRVQGNDLMLPKGNVSKHHARLLYRDGRFIVTDLKSTNGTYVNGRKITQATIVREGDKIYIGDFVLRVDLGGVGAVSSADMSEGQATAIPSGGEEHRMPPGMPPLPGAPTGGPPPMPMPGPPMPQPPMQQMQPQMQPQMQQMQQMQPPMQQMQPMGQPMPQPMPPMPMPPMGAPMPGPPMPGPPMPQPPMPMAQQQQMQPPMPMPMPMPAPPMTPPQAAIPRTSAPAAPRDQVSHYPLERDPDDSEGAAGGGPAVPGPPRVPAVSDAAQQRPGRGTLAMNSGAPQGSPAPGQVQARPSAPPIASPRPHAPSRLPPKETPAQVGRRLALMSLVDRIGEVMDVAKLGANGLDAAAIEGVQRAARDQGAGMRDEGEVPEGVDVDVVVKDAVRELTGLGAIGPLLDDDEVSEIHCLKADQVLAVRAGQLVLADCVFTKDDAVARAIARLATLSGEPLAQGELVVERRLPKGVQMLAFLPPASSAHALVLRKRRRVEMSLEDFVRLGAMSRQMATFMEHCLAARANVLVAASGPHLAATFVGAMASAGSAGDRVAVLQDEEEFSISHAHVLSLGVGDPRNAEQVLLGAARLRPDRLVIGALHGRIVGAALDAIAGGAEGVLAAASAPSLRHALSRLVSQLVLARPGLGLEAAREMVGEAFDVAVEVTVLSDGRYRVTRVAELSGGDAKGVVARDLFTAQADGPEGGHQATGVVPRIANEFASRGVRMDPNLFKKGR